MSERRGGWVADGNTDSSVVLSQEWDGPVVPDGFADCPSYDMHDWSPSQQVGDLISVFSEAHPFVGIYSEMAEVSTCPGKDWSSAHQQADLVNVFLQVAAEARSISIPAPSVDVSSIAQLRLHVFHINIAAVFRCLKHNAVFLHCTPLSCDGVDTTHATSVHG
jgi:hypothetical protein